MFTRLLVPLDGSELAEEVLPHAEHLASSLSLDIELVRVSKLASTSTPYSATLLASDHVDVDAGVEAEAVKYLDGIAARLKSSGFAVSAKVVRGAPSEEILRLAHETAGCVIALVTHGRTGMKRWVLGSVAEAIVKDAEVPVLIIPPAKPSKDQ